MRLPSYLITCAKEKYIFNISNPLWLKKNSQSSVQHSSNIHYLGNWYPWQLRLTNTSQVHDQSHQESRGKIPMSEVPRAEPETSQDNSACALDNMTNLQGI